MSLLNEVSLLLTPNAYKEGKLYSIIPSNGNGDFMVTRATTATRVNSAGLVEVVPYNLVTWSNDFTNVDWNELADTGCTITITPNYTTTTEGLTATRVVATRPNTSLISALRNSTPNAEINATKSVWIKNNNSGSVNIMLADSIITINDIWQRYSITNGYPYALLGLRYAGSALSCDISIAGFQFVAGSLPLTYQPTTTRLNIPRLDYSNGTCPSLLVEPQRTNLLTWSSVFDAVSWIKAGATVTANNILAPDGTMTADRVVFGAANNYIFQQTSSIATTANKSIYIKGTAGQTISLDDTWSVSPSNLITLTGDWQRVNFTSTTTSGQNQGLAISTYQSATARTIWVWGAQLEVGTYPTSYIPTTSASVTRNADVVSKTGISSLIGQTEGTFVFTINAVKPIGLGIQLIMRASNDSEVQLFFVCYINNLGILAFDFYIAGVYTFNLSTPSAIQTGLNTVGLVYKAGAYQLYLNGVQVATSTNSTAITNTISKIGLDTASGPMYINLVSVYKTVLTANQLELATGTSFNTYAEMASYYNYTLQ
jgi:hypothetical protein